MEFDEFLEHYGVKGMRWGRRKSKAGSSSGKAADPTSEARKAENHRKMVKGAKIAAGILAVAGAVAIGVAVNNQSNNKKADKAINDMLNTPFKWKDQSGEWQKYTKTGLYFDTDPVWKNVPQPIPKRRGGRR